MLLWGLFVVVNILMISSIVIDRRRFINAIYLALYLILLFLLTSSLADSQVVQLILALMMLGGMIFSLLIMPAWFIISGLISVVRHRLSLSHSLSILFGLAIWGSGYGLIYLIKIPHDDPWLAPLELLLMIGLGYVLFTFMALALYSWVYQLIPKNFKCDFIIVHGAGLIKGQWVTPLLAHRLDKAVEVYEWSNRRAKLIVSGGQGADELISEAAAMRNYLTEVGVPESDILLEDQSTTTRENIQLSKQLIEQTWTESKRPRVLFVTNDYHVFRTSIYARQARLRAEGVGCQTALYYLPSAFIREYIALMVEYRISWLVLIIGWLVISVIWLIIH